MSDIVLDASALLAVLNEESGAEIVEAALSGATISTVNLSEVLAKLAEAGMPDEAAWSAVGGLGLTTFDFDLEMARIAGSLRPATRKRGLSFGDRACLALARKLGLPVLTADRSWTKVDLGMPIKTIR